MRFLCIIIFHKDMGFSNTYRYFMARNNRAYAIYRAKIYINNKKILKMLTNFKKTIDNSQTFV